MTEHASGSQVIAALDTAYKLGTTDDPTDGVFCLFVDTSVMERGDRIVLRVFEKVRSTGTKRRVLEIPYTNEQSDPVAYTPWFPLMHAWDFEIEQTDGTARTFEWSIRKA